MKKNQISKILKQIVTSLVKGMYSNIFLLDRDQRLSAEEINYAIESYKGELSMPPDDAFSSFYSYKQKDGIKYLIEFDLWFDGSKSDLTLIVTIFDSGEYSIEDIHVL